MRKVFVLLLSVLVVSGLASPVSAAERTLLHEGLGAYPRLIRLEHGGPLSDGRILAAMTSKDANGHYTPIYESTDEGSSFSRVGTVRDPAGAEGMCCGTLYELPERVGRMRAGTLLWAASYRQQGGDDRQIGIRVWASRDMGRTWSFLAEPVRSHNYDGVWEPEFTVDAGGTLWMHYADETEAPRYAQVLNRVASVDGTNWGTKQRTMAIPPDRVRPGMPIVRRLPDGRYYFAYEICNYGDRFCDPYFKISPDGANFGDPAAPGTRVQAANGKHFQHAQTISLFPGGPTGTRILMVGQIYVDRNGKKLPGNGRTLLANDHLGSGDWYEVPAPVHVNDPYDNWCPNYSSTLLPVDDGQNVLQVAADYTGGVCKAYFGKGPAG
ncbi:sialidase family protein [Prauserella cavernicola]|uniref:Exo-alpha-sialidase n=1 Tax=Prauserella cavernicola TaxID=2800127 RepID=A0A934QQ36_9PSEU|nr:sialidase family protein [Prauserella cavernicola]MBK1784112.1 exo-alpha-sialidase [Prauserella cavernicola]